MGLGNPGTQYSGNRHNVGFQCLNHIARAHGLDFKDKASQARLATGRLASQDIVLAKPQTYMNLSGKSAAALLSRYRLSTADLLVIYDDVDLPLGRIRVRAHGGAGGHRGLSSIAQALGTQDIARIRVGVSRPETMPGEGLRDYVLEDFTGDEREVLRDVLARVDEAVICVLEAGVEAAMNRFNSS